MYESCRLGTDTDMYTTNVYVCMYSSRPYLFVSVHSNIQYMVRGAGTSTVEDVKLSWQYLCTYL